MMTRLRVWLPREHGAYLVGDDGRGAGTDRRCGSGQPTAVAGALRSLGWTLVAVSTLTTAAIVLAA
jgi:hypothetical protein